MAESGKRKLKFTCLDLSKDGREALGGLEEIRWGMSADSILKAVEALKAECGGDVSIEVRYDDHCGSETDCRWSRQETNDEHTARLVEEENMKEEKRARKAQAKLDDAAAELKTLDKLRKKYPNYFMCR